MPAANSLIFACKSVSFAARQLLSAFAKPGITRYAFERNCYTIPGTQVYTIHDTLKSQPADSARCQFVDICLQDGLMCGTGRQSRLLPDVHLRGTDMLSSEHWFVRSRFVDICLQDGLMCGTGRQSRRAVLAANSLIFACKTVLCAAR